MDIMFGEHTRNTDVAKEISPESIKKRQLAEKATLIIAKEFQGLRLIMLYGSVARGEARNDSDIDLALVFTGNREKLPNIFDRYDTLGKKFAKEKIPFPHPHVIGGLNLHPIPEEELQNSQDSFIRSVCEEGIVLWAKGA
ncbi:MAG: nucleotidyltransferase domain-containing protein [bacterium]|nr:nucleotidyltransferase domain-containing protein [bacterium]